MEQLIMQTQQSADLKTKSFCEKDAKQQGEAV